MFRFTSYALWKPFSLSGLQELHDQGVTEVMLSLCTRNMASTTTILELAEDHRKYFPEMKFTIVPAFIINQIFTKPCRFYKGHLEGYDYDHLLFSYHGFQSVTFAKQTLQNHIVKLMDLAVIHPAHEFCYRHQCYETTKQVVKLLEGKYSQTFQSV
jgi:ferrochelatase